MKKLSMMFAAMAAFVLLGAVSCSKDTDNGYDGEPGTGKVVIAFNFDTQEAGRADYTTSASKPTTSWKNNITSLTLFLVDPLTDMVKVALPVTELPTDDDIAAESFTFTNVPAGDYTGYLVANFDQSNANFSGSTINQDIDDLLMGMVALTSWPKDPVSEATSTAYEEAPEIFLAVRPNTDVDANTTNDYFLDTNDHFILTRAVSLIRVRINNSVGDGVDNTKVDFSHADASLRIRRIGTSLNPKSTVAPSPALSTNLIWDKGWNIGNTPPTGYSAGLLIDATNGQSAWKDLRVYPGGGTGTSANKFNIVVSGMAEAGYVPSGATTGLAAPALVYWDGTVEAAVTANNILELNVDLKSQGKPTVPIVTETGSLIIGVGLANWGSISGVYMPI